MKKILTIVAIFGWAGACFAPINLPYRPANGVRPDVATEEQLQREQMNQQQIGNLGGVPSGTERRDDIVQPTSGEPDAASTVAGAETPNDPAAGETIKQAEKNIQSEKGGLLRMLLWAMVLGAFGFAVVFGVRKWADRALPEIKYR